MNILEHIKSFIQEHSIMVLATAKDNTPYACTVFYVTQDANVLYLKSYAVSLHTQIILENPSVACAIYDKESSSFGDKIGVQLLGKAHKVTDLEEVTKAAELYISTFNSPKEKFYPLENLIKEDAKSSIYRIDVEKVKMLDSRNHIEPTDYLAMQ